MNFFCCFVFHKYFQHSTVCFLNNSERLFELSWNNAFKRKDGFRNNLKCLSKPSSDNVEIKIDFVLFNVKRIHRKKTSANQIGQSENRSLTKEPLYQTEIKRRKKISKWTKKKKEYFLNIWSTRAFFDWP